MPSPCLHPVRTWNKSLRRTVFVPCGHCAACRVNQGRNLSLRVNNEFSQYVYKFFITLTYEDSFLPIAKYDSELDGFVHPHDVDYLDCPHIVSLGDPMVEKSDLFLCKVLQKFDGIPVLSHSDVRNFKKRLRYYLFKELKDYDDIFLYTCGEYGAKRFRPHYHILFGTNERRVSDILRSCVARAWSDNSGSVKGCSPRSYGKIDFQACIDSGSTNYCAQYLTCTTNLPFVLSRTVFRPFHTKSRKFENKPSSEGLRRLFYELPTESTLRSSNGKFLVSKHTKDDLYQVFPFVPGFSSLSSNDRCRVYEVFNRYMPSTAGEFARHWLAFNLRQSRRDLLACDQVIMNLCFSEGKIKDYKTCFHIVSNVYCASRIVCKNAKTLGLSVTDYVRQIENYESKLELRKLHDFYESLVSYMGDPYHPLSLADSFGLYYNTEDDLKNLHYYYSQFGLDDTRPRSISTIPQQADYSALCKKIETDSCKTKKRNDEFEAKGLKRMPYLPVVRKNFRKFLSLI